MNLGVVDVCCFVYVYLVKLTCVNRIKYTSLAFHWHLQVNCFQKGPSDRYTYLESFECRVN